jgi:hypothetical protein
MSRTIGFDAPRQYERRVQTAQKRLSWPDSNSKFAWEAKIIAR